MSSTDLFGNEIDPPPVEPTPSRPVMNDVRAIADVLNRAVSESGYVIAGPSRRAYRRVGNDSMKTVPTWEQNAVSQLLDAGQLTVGGSYLLRCGAVRQSVNSVLVPRSTRSMLQRWNALKPLGKVDGSSKRKGA